jgi:NDP-sugar pyrophosphorylase family protein
MLPVVILAGGLATRMLPITAAIPKSLIAINGEAFIDHQLRYLRHQGIKEVVICCGHQAEMIQTALANKSHGLSIHYSHDGPNLLGTGGAIKKALPALPDAFFVLYGDSYLPIDFAAVENAYFQAGKPALMTILKNHDQWDKSNVLFYQETLIEYNKQSPRSEMAFIDYGLGILSQSVFDHHKTDDTFDLSDLYHKLSLQGQLAGYQVYERFYEIGSLQGLKETEIYLKGNYDKLFNQVFK